MVSALRASLQDEHGMLEQFLALSDTDTVTCSGILMRMADSRKRISSILSDIHWFKPKDVVCNFIEALTFLIEEAVTAASKQKYVSNQEAIMEATRIIRRHAVQVAGLQELLEKYAEGKKHEES